MRTLAALATLLAAVTLIACSSAPQNASKPTFVADVAPPEIAAEVAEAPPSDPEPVVEVHSFPATGLTELPTGFVLDGAIGEWDDTGDIKLVLTNDGLTIAGRVPEHAPQEGPITVLFQFGSRELPTVGAPLRGGGVFELNCETTWDGQPMPASEAAYCQGLMAAATQFEAEWEAESRRTWHIGLSGVTTAKGAEIAGARSSVRRGGEVTFEAQLPLDALPLASESPVTSATAFITTTLRDPNPHERNPVGVLFGDGVRFGLLAELRQRALDEWGLGLVDGVPAVGYRLGNDTTWVVARRAPGWLSYERAELPVLSRETTHKSFEIGTLYAGTDRLVTVKDNKVVGMEAAINGELVGDKRRPPGLHVFAYDSYSDEVGNRIANWTVYMIDAEGEISSSVLPSPVSAWEKVEPFHSKDFASFGLVGRPANAETTGEARVTFAYVPAARLYEPKTTGLE